MLRRHDSMLLSVTAVVALTAGSACRKGHREETDAASIASVTAAEHPLPTVTVQPRGPETSQNLEKVMTYSGLSAPANVFHDVPTDRYLISNVGGKLTAVDGDGFISAFSPAGTIAEARWIVSGKGGVTLNAPKGLAVTRDVLYVADIDTVRFFDSKTGAPKGEIKIPGAVYLAGMAAAPDGRVFVADAGVAVQEDGSLKAVNDGAIWTLNGLGRPPTKMVTKESLGGPAAIDVRPDGRLLVATLMSGSVYRLDPAGKKHDELKASRGKLDGVVEVGNKIYVSSWDAAAVYRRIEGGMFAVQLADLKGPGGLAFDVTRSRIVVPLLSADRVDVYKVD